MKMYLAVAAACLCQSFVYGQFDLGAIEVRVVETPARQKGESAAAFQERVDQANRAREHVAVGEIIRPAADASLAQPVLAASSSELDAVRAFYEGYPSLITHFQSSPPENAALRKILDDAIKTRKSILKSCATTSVLSAKKRREVVNAECGWEDKLCIALDEIYTPAKLDDMISRTTPMHKRVWLTSQVFSLRCGDMSKADLEYLRKCKVAHAMEFLKMVSDPPQTMDHKSLPVPTKRLTAVQFEAALHMFRDIKPRETIADFWAKLSPSQQHAIVQDVPSLKQIARSAGYGH